MAVGKGIIGSSDEEKSRKKVDWNQGRAYLVPHNGGKAMGFVHSKNSDAEEGDPVGHAIMYTIKIPPENLESEPPESECEWVRDIRTLCSKALVQSNEGGGGIDKTAQEAWIPLNDDDTCLVRKTITDLSES